MTKEWMSRATLDQQIVGRDVCAENRTNAASITSTFSSFRSARPRPATHTLARANASNASLSKSIFTLRNIPVVDKRGDETIAISTVAFLVDSAGDFGIFLRLRGKAKNEFLQFFHCIRHEQTPWRPSDASRHRSVTTWSAYSVVSFVALY